MPKTLEKTRKQIARKRNGVMDALHQNSRDSKRLHRAQVRDSKLARMATARRKNETPLLDRATYFQEAARANDGKAVDLDLAQKLIEVFVHQYDVELDELKKARRPGKPSSTKQDLFKMKVEALLKEHKDGFFMPDLTDQANVELLNNWEGSWSYLTTVSWVRVSAAGVVKQSSFPPKGSH